MDKQDEKPTFTYNCCLVIHSHLCHMNHCLLKLQCQGGFSIPCSHCVLYLYLSILWSESLTCISLTEFFRYYISLAITTIILSFRDFADVFIVFDSVFNKFNCFLNYLRCLCVIRGFLRVLFLYVC